MTVTDLKLAAYLEEAGDDLKSACATLETYEITYAVLRGVWTGPIESASDETCQQIRKTLGEHSISVICICSEVGKATTNQLASIDLSRLFDIVSYFKAPFVRFHVGIKASAEPSQIDAWMARVTDHCLSSNVVPLLEINHESAIGSAAELAVLMAKHRRWKLLYDPVQLILRQNQDPFVRYWTLLKQFVGAIDVRDFKIGHGFKPVGFGDSKIGLTIKDSVASRFAGWYFLEPGLGRRHASAVTRTDTFKMAMEAFNVLLSSI